jgi:hypothetical protein
MSGCRAFRIRQNIDGYNMKKRKRSTPANPFTAWTRLAMTTGEMLAASAQVISHRTARMAAAGPAPDARDRTEFHLMGQEKLEAVAESAQAVTMRMIAANQQMAAIAFDQFFGRTARVMALATSQTMVQASQRQAALVKDTLNHSMKAAEHISRVAPQIAQHGLKPIHSRATGNAKRLQKVKIVKTK